MARVIKGGGAAGGQKPPRPPTRVVVDPGLKKVIGRDVFQAKQDAEHILKRAEQERQGLINDGKKMAARAREEAMARGASEAFAAAAAEALTAFKRRAERYAAASDDVRVLALEVAKKVLGTEADLGPAQVDKILQRGMAQLRARRRLRLQVSHKRLGELAYERPNLMKALQSEPDLVVEGVDDVGTGFARVVTEIGGALCAEETALDALSQAVNVREQPRDPRGRVATGNTAVGDGPQGISELRRSTALSGGDSVSEAAVVEEDELDALDGDDDGSSARTRRIQALGEEMEDETINLPSKGLTQRPPRARTEEIEVIPAEEDDADEVDGDDGRAAMPERRPQSAVPRARPATRAVPLDAMPLARPLGDDEDDDDDTMQQAPVVKRRDEDLDLFTDDAPRKRR